MASEYDPQKDDFLHGRLKLTTAYFHPIGDTPKFCWACFQGKGEHNETCPKRALEVAA